MRIVEFSYTGGPVDYTPYGSLADFKNTHLDEDISPTKIIGEYYGSANEATLPTYTGTWPIPKMEYRTQLQTYEFMGLFTPAEFDEVYTSTDLGVRQFRKMLEVAGNVDTMHATAVAGMSAIVADTSITQGRADTILLGIQEEVG